MGKPITPLLTVDCVIVDARGRVLLIERGNDPFKGHYALPGGFVDLNETCEAACRREVKEETSLHPRVLKLVGVYSKPGRDPRGPTVSVAYLARVKAARPVAGDDAVGTLWAAEWKRLPLAFDHKIIIRDALRLVASDSAPVRKAGK